MHRSIRRAAQALPAICGVAVIAAAPAQAARSTTQSVKLRFAAVAGGHPVTCGRLIQGLGTTHQGAQLQDLRFYVTDVELLRRKGSPVRITLRGGAPYQVIRKGKSVTLIDLENGTGACKAAGTPGTNPFVQGTVPRGTYTGVRFTVGVPPALNHTDTVSAPAPLNVDAMAWSWQYGRKFMRIEFVDPGGPTGAWPAHQFLVHLGSTGCSGNPATGQAAGCTALNMPVVVLNHFNLQRQLVALDLGKLLAGDDITVNRADEPGCMSGPTDPECGSVFGALGLSWRTDGRGTGRSTGKQDVFGAMTR
ncbi:MAG TPA: MbnP family copper-binding protein [Solirubrobacteraceae bacterium]|nr:MbnP family copper-binding protein [Solirubrobacteraceae bacterium]